MKKKPNKIRHCLYFERKLSEELDALTAAPGTTKSDIVNAALIAYLRQRGANHIERNFRPRLDRMDDRPARMERDLQIALESIGLFVRYQLSVTPPLPASQLAASQATRNDRFQTFIDQVSRRVAKGKTFGADVIARAQQPRDGAPAKAVAAL